MDIKEKYPKPCWNCEHARATWSEELEKQGYTGCAYPIKFAKEDNSIIFQISKVKQYAEGWIYSGRRPLDRTESKTLGSGSTINDQLILKEINHCTKFTKI